MSENVYRVLNKETRKVRLVRADTRSQAMRHVAEDTLEIRVATADDAHEAAMKGIAIESYHTVIPPPHERPAMNREAQAEQAALRG